MALFLLAVTICKITGLSLKQHCDFKQLLGYIDRTKCFSTIL